MLRTVVFLALSIALALGCVLELTAQPAIDQRTNELPREAVGRVGSARLRQGELVSGMAFLPDGKTLVTVGTSGLLRFWNLSTGEWRMRVALESPTLFHLAVAEDGSTIGVGGVDGYVLLDGEGKELKRHTFEKGKVVSIVTSRDGKRVATVSRDGDALVRDSRTGEQLQTVTIVRARPNPFFGDCSFTPDGKALAIVNMLERTVGMYDLATGKTYHTFASVQDQVRVCLIAPDGRTMVTLAYRDNSVALWDLATGKLRHHVKDELIEPNCVRFAPDGKALAVGGAGPDVVLLDAAKGSVIRRFEWSVNRVSGLALNTGVPPPNIVRIAFSADGKTLAAANADGVIVLWDVATGARRPVSADPAGAIRELRFIGKGERLLTIADGADVWDWTANKRVLRAASLPYSRAGVPTPDGLLIAVVNNDASITLVDSQTGKPRHVLTGHGATIRHAVFSPDGKLLISADGNQSVRTWDTSSGAPLRHWTCSFDPSNQLAVSPDGAQLALIQPQPNAPEVRLVESATGNRIREITLPPLYVSATAYSPDGASLVVVGNEPGMVAGKVILVDVATGRLNALRDYDGRITAVAFSPNGRMLATGRANNTLQLWEVETGQLRHSFIGHQGEINALAFSADGRKLAAAGLDGPVLVWEVFGTPKPARVPTDTDWRARHWGLLDSKDSVHAFDALRTLAQYPDDAVAICRDFLKPTPGFPKQQFQQLLRDLDDTKFAVREKATRELRQHFEAVEQPLRELVLAPGTSAEVRRRVQALLEEKRTPTPTDLQRTRVLEALELAGGPDALQLLDTWAKADPSTRFSRAAKDAATRLRAR